MPQHDRQLPEVPLIYQEEPEWCKRSPRKLHGWTETELGYINEAEKLCLCLMSNSAKYTWSASINVEATLSPIEITEIWKKACRKLNAAGVVALWVREPSRSNHCNYHLLVKSEQSQKELIKAIENAMPDRSKIRWHKQVQAVKNQFQYIRYITKARTQGFVNGKFVLDRHADKRLLFKPNLGLRKVGTIGKFWAESRAKIWDDICAREKRIAEKRVNPELRLLARGLHDLVGQDISLKKIERILAEQE